MYIKRFFLQKIKYNALLQNCLCFYFLTHLSIQSGRIIVANEKGTAGSLTIPTEAALKADPNTHLMVYLSNGGGGRAFTSSPCKENKKLQFCKVGCMRGGTGYSGAIGCASVSTARSIEIVPRGGPPFWLMESLFG